MITLVFVSVSTAKIFFMPFLPTLIWLFLSPNLVSEKSMDIVAGFSVVNILGFFRECPRLDRYLIPNPSWLFELLISFY